MSHTEQSFMIVFIVIVLMVMAFFADRRLDALEREHEHQYIVIREDCTGPRGMVAIELRDETC